MITGKLDDPTTEYTQWEFKDLNDKKAAAASAAALQKQQSQKQRKAVEQTADTVAGDGGATNAGATQGHGQGHSASSESGGWEDLAANPAQTGSVGSTSTVNGGATSLTEAAGVATEPTDAEKVAEQVAAYMKDV